MITTLLFDLDDTLLGNPMGTFLPTYFEQIVQIFPPEFAPARLVTTLLDATRAAIANRQPARNLLDVFNQHFFPALGLATADWLPRLNEFYQTRFPELRRVTQPVAQARAGLEWAIAHGYEVVIATSPLFPRLAVEERLRWAGIGDLPFARVTYLENSHFAKPHPEYFAEILAHLGRRPDEALMIGNDWDNDIAPSIALGMANYWIAEPGQTPPSPNGINQHTFGSGTLAAFFEWAKATLPSLTLPPPPARALPPLLIGNLAATHQMLNHLAEPAWTQRPTPEEWSLTEIVCHLRDVDTEVNAPRFRAIVESDNPFISGADTHPWAVERNYQAQSGSEALRAFSDVRQRLVAYLSQQPTSAWNRTARHSLFGPTTLAEAVSWILDHDRIHLEQMRKTL